MNIYSWTSQQFNMFFHSQKHIQDWSPAPFPKLKKKTSKAVETDQVSFNLILQLINFYEDEENNSNRACI